MNAVTEAIRHEDENPGHITTGEGDHYYCLGCVWTTDDLDAALARKTEPCRATTMVGPHEFICVLDAHGDERTDQFDSRGMPARWRRHFFKRRWLHGTR